MNKVRTRFAPSPTGYLHIGGLRTAMYAYLFAKKNGGDFILRIEDTDLERYVDGSIEIIYRTLKDAGLNYDEGPDVAGGKFGPYIQSQRKDLYLGYAKELIEKGGAYYCFCDDKRISSLKDENGIAKYDKHCLNLSKQEIDKKLKNGEKYVIRQNVPTDGESCYQDMVFGEIKVEYKDIEDGILIKSDGLPTYNFANVVDDHLMQISHVIRGTEYLSSTPKYNLMYDAFGWERPVYMHLSPIMKDANHKLSKRNGDASYEDLLAKGFLKEAIINYIALLGWSPKGNQEKMTLAEIQENFSVDGLSKSPAIFDIQKLTWLNGEYIKSMETEKFNEFATPYYEKSEIAGKLDYLKVSTLLKTRVETFAQISEKVQGLTEFSKFDLALFDNKKMKTDREVAKMVLPKTVVEIQLIDENNFNVETVHSALAKVIAENGLKNGQVFWTFRIAITGKESTPGGANEMADLYGKKECLARLKQSIVWLNE